MPMNGWEWGDRAQYTVGHALSREATQMTTPSPDATPFVRRMATRSDEATNTGTNKMTAAGV